MITKLKQKDISQVVKIYCNELSGFLPELGDEFLKKFYRASLSIPEMFTFVAKKDDEVLGFATGVVTTKGLYKKIIMKDLLRFGLLFLKYLFTRQDLLVKIVKSFQYPGFSSSGSELLTIAVAKRHQRRGIGTKLFQKIVDDFEKRSIKEFKISVYDDLPANDFYRKMKCRFVRSFPFLEGKMNYYIHSGKTTPGVCHHIPGVKGKHSVCKILIGTLTLLLLIYFLYWRFRLGIVRYFDVDEFTHLHWGYSVFIGEKPYTNFFYIFPPFFLYPIASIFLFFGRSIKALIAARIFIFIVFLATAKVLFLLAKKLKGTLFALVVVLIFSFLPLPFDKMIEIRPDLVATLFSLLGLYFLILGAEGKKLLFIILSGFFYSFSFGFVPKTVFFLIPVVVLLCYRFSQSDIFFFLIGMIPSALLVFSIIVFYGKPAFAIYSMTRLSAKTATVLGSKFYMRPDIFFYPNQTYYGLWGYSRPYIVNLVIYISASLFAIFRMISSLSFKNRKKCIREFLIAGSFFASLYGFVFIFPLKHAQYLIPVAPFIAIYFADFLFTLLGKIKYAYIRNLIIFLTLLTIGFVGREMNLEKIKWGNKKTFDKIALLKRTLPPDEPLFDLTGESVMFPNGYYFCCLPYGQYQEALTFKLPNIEKELERRNTKYIYTGALGRLNVLPITEQSYIRENFVNYFPDGSLLIRKGKAR